MKPIRQFNPRLLEFLFWFCLVTGFVNLGLMQFADSVLHNNNLAKLFFLNACLLGFGAWANNHELPTKD